jgi:hypothetical protein
MPRSESYTASSYSHKLRLVSLALMLVVFIDKGTSSSRE